MNFTAQKRKRTLFVGLDAACWEYYQPLLDAGKLPAMQALVGAGITGIARSTMPAWTPTAWASIVTGKNPGKHGVYDMMWLRPNSYEFTPTNARFRQGTPFWTRLNQAGLRVGLVNIPFTHPPDPVEGFVVTGFGSPSGQPDFAYPPEVCDWIRSRYGDYEPWLRFNEFKDRDSNALIRADIRHQENQVAMAVALAQRYEVDVLAINLMVPDHANHLAHNIGRINQAIIRTDQHLQRLLDSFQPENVMLFSDHGSRRVRADFLLHVWLRDKGYTVQKERAAQDREAILNSIVGSWFRKAYRLPRLLEYVPRRLLLSGFQRWPENRRRSFWRAIERRMPFAKSIYELDFELDYSQTRVFVGSSRSGLLYLNQIGKHPQGVIPPSEREGILAALIADLEALEDPFNGGAIFNSVHTADEIYRGPAVEIAPDITLDFYNSPWNIMHTFRRGAYVENARHRYFVPNHAEFGHHSRDGLYVFSGSDFSTGGEGPVFSMMDLPSTLLHLYEVPTPEDWDGQVHGPVFSPQLAQAPIRHQEGDPDLPFDYEQIYTGENNEELIERLKALGYL